MDEPRHAGRELFASRWGAIFSLLGVAIGLGNVWRFPYMMGLFGGGAFLVIYLLVVAAFGIPALMAELALGRATRQGPLTALAAAGIPGGKVLGGMLFAGVGMAMSYYLVVVGWILAYLALAVANLGGITDNFSRDTFGWLQASWPLQIACAALVAGASAEVVARGVRRGIEKASSLFVPLFGVLMVVLAIRSVTLPGAGEGITYLLTPDWEGLSRRAVLSATGQAFFSLGLGGTFFVIYGSYLDERESLARRAVGTAAGDVLASLLAAFAVIPAVFATGLSPASGPPLLFEVLPEACLAMPGGLVFAVLFFAGLGSVAFLSGVAAVEVLVGSLADRLPISRRKSSWAICMGLVVLGFPATRSLDYLYMSDQIWGSTMQPLGSVIAVAALTWGLGKRHATAQMAAQSGAAPAWVASWYLWLRYVVPIGVVAALVSGWI
ncbi:MAG TPA: sodium-dependent transporter [Acidobacteriota bacterium]|jgi:NSS family neurotransmitter:Na+ symporter